MVLGGNTASLSIGLEVDDIGLEIDDNVVFSTRDGEEVWMKVCGTEVAQLGTPLSDSWLSSSSESFIANQLQNPSDDQS